MPVKEVDGKWHTVNKRGKVGKRAFKTRESAEAASSRGKALYAGSPVGSESSSPSSSTSFESPDTSEERKKLGIGRKPVTRGEF